MKRILVSLVSDQTIPNIEFIKEMWAETDAYLFISTKAMEAQGRRDWIIQTTGIPPEKVLEPIVVKEFSFEDIDEKLSSRIDETEGVTYLVNLTGGTKIMSLAVYEFFKSLSSEMYYLTGDGKKIKLHPGRKKVASDLSVKISLKDYLNAYGFALKDSSQPIRTIEDTQLLLYYFLHGFDKDQDVPILEKFRAARGSGIKDLDGNPDVKDFLEKIKFSPKQAGKLSKYECRYLSGEWLEEYLYLFLIQQFNIDDSHIGMGVTVEKEAIKNEFDVILMKNNKIYLFECKTSIYLGQEGGQTFITETIYKSDSLRDKFGLFGQTTIVTLSDLNTEKLTDHKNRAEASRVKLIGRKSFLEGTLFEDLKKI